MTSEPESVKSRGAAQPRVRQSLFWRLWWRSLTLKRPQAVLAISSVLVGATVASMLLNVYGDARRKMTQEFRAYGPNIVLAPADRGERVYNSQVGGGISGGGIDNAGIDAVLDDGVMNQLRPFVERRTGMAAVPVLYVVTRLKKTAATDGAPSRPDAGENVVAVGTDFDALRRLNPSWRTEGNSKSSSGQPGVIGAHIAGRLGLGVGDTIELGTLTGSPPAVELTGQVSPGRERHIISGIVSTGASEDDQVFVPLASLQQLAQLPGKISLVEMGVPGETVAVERVISDLRQALRDRPSVEIRPIRQIVYSAGKVLDTIRWLMFSLTALVLIIITLCVMATMTAIVLERRKDIAVMKSLGATDHILVQLFLSEGAALGLIGGVAGYVLGLGLAYEMTHQLFNVDLSFTWWTLPLVCGASVALAVLATFFPVEMVHGIQPARVLRGE